MHDRFLQLCPSGLWLWTPDTIMNALLTIWIQPSLAQCYVVRVSFQVVTKLLTILALSYTRRLPILSLRCFLAKSTLCQQRMSFDLRLAVCHAFPYFWKEEEQKHISLEFHSRLEIRLHFFQLPIREIEVFWYSEIQSSTLTVISDDFLKMHFFRSSSEWLHRRGWDTDNWKY